MIEEFRDVEGYKGLYQVSNLGRVKNIKDKILKGCDAGKGYLKVNLSKEGKSKNVYIHQLVAIAFLNHTPNGNKVIVDHVNNNRSNNRLENLQLITHRLNLAKDRRNKTSKFTGVSWNTKEGLWVSRICVNYKVKFLGYFTNELEASNAYQKALHSL